MKHPSWICCQLGAREHYAIARSLYQAGNLSLLITDAWVKPQSLLNSFPNPLLKSLQERFYPDLVAAPVASFTGSLLRFEVSHRVRKTGDWERMIARNRWFQKQVIRHLEAIQSRRPFKTPPVLFTYSYAALDILCYAKSKGWMTVLGQIDPGIFEEKIVLAEHQKHPNLASSWQPVPPKYWEDWQTECTLSDCILVNSNWSKQALQQVGIDEQKIEVVPLVYTPQSVAKNFQRTYPDRFSQQRPLRVLFLGQVILRKGAAALLEAAKLLQDKPIEFWIVGRSEVTSTDTCSHNIRWIGAVSRSETVKYYQQADVFLFPTLSDGFGLTQLEAQAWKLPLIVSKFCGEVVIDGINGKVLPEVTGGAIAILLQSFVEQPQLLLKLSQSCHSQTVFGLSKLAEQLQALT
ncbi:glycosyltransferase family 4 protein [Leptolyngbya sp. FACHB-541]|uniref:glycosyltransferase family 4 protein n=1 Tax=Leptolyngbya sp. FACHB-541 TaxID=2692810 RepID=UPI001682DB18|nr:glycosyltransferase family 4 protein [Leptolyngbya sp. FACHB-541]MBD2001061.1 glycosyltransferase family 4 protein [Leptolyngbya sp. FACHB-541]